MLRSQKRATLPHPHSLTSSLGVHWSSHFTPVHSLHTVAYLTSFEFVFFTIVITHADSHGESQLNMANVLGGGDGMMGGFPLEQWFYEMPVCTRWWMTAALSASVLVQCHIISPFQLFYSVRTVFFKSQVR